MDTVNRVGYKNPPKPQFCPKRLAARKAGAIKYLGIPCKNGHSGLRYTRNGGCIDCASYHFRKHGKVKDYELS